MNFETISNYISKYGVIAIFVIVFLEYLNLPGFPAGIILPAAGIMALHGNINFFFAVLVSLLAGVCGSWVLYVIGRIGGTVLLGYLERKHPKKKVAIDSALVRINDKGYWGLFLSKFIPIVRTVISIPAGIVKMNFLGYTLFSAMGIFIWNLFFIGAGYLLGDAVFTMFK